MNNENTSRNFENVMRPRLAKWLKVGEGDVFRWVFWKEFAGNAPDEDDLVRLMDQMMDADWHLIKSATSDGPLKWNLHDMLLRIRCLICSKAHDLNIWMCRRTFDNICNGVVDEEKARQYASERLEVLKRRGDLLMYELEDAAHCYEKLGDKENANRCYQAIIDRKLKGTKWASASPQASTPSSSASAS